MEFRKTISCGKSPMNSNQSPKFWGLEVEAHKSLIVKPDQDFFIHISRATLDKGKKGESAVLYVTIDGKKLVIGTLTHRNTPQISLDLFFEKEFKLSHNCDCGSVYFIGYQSHFIEQVEGDHSSEEEEDVEIPATVHAIGNFGALVVNPDSEKGMEMGKFDSVDEEEESLKQLEPSNKKRANESAPKTPLSAKKAKLAATPQWTGKNVLVHCSESKANLKKKNIHKEKSEENDEEIEEMKKSIKELSDAMKKLQQSQTTKAGLLEVLSKRYHEELKVELKGSAVDAAPVVEESVPDAAYTQSAEDDMVKVIMSNRGRRKLYNMKNEAVVTIKQRKPKLNAAQQ